MNNLTSPAASEKAPYTVGLVTDTKNPLVEGELLLLEALKVDSDFEVKTPAWDDPSVDWSEFGTLVIRSSWDYHNNVPSFVRWAKGVSESGVNLLNPPEVIAWNSDKKYLLDLQKAGVTILPTIVLGSSNFDSIALPDSKNGWVVKPTQGASASGVAKFRSDQEHELRQYAKDLSQKSGDVLVQSYAPEISDGEFSFVFFDGEFSHAAIKTPAKDDFRVQPNYGGRERYHEATDNQIAQARAVIDAAPHKIFYARVDMIEVAGRLTLMELEAIEPYLFFEYNNAPKMFISALKRYLQEKPAA
jgi:glutathione synthase/RimK-type ligase-like ATP-grasp enzyme